MRLHQRPSLKNKGLPKNSSKRKIVLKKVSCWKPHCLEGEYMERRGEKRLVTNLKNARFLGKSLFLWAGLSLVKR